MDDQQSGLCECGCGERPRIAARNDARWGSVKGRPRRFVKGHDKRGGNRRLEARGYVLVLVPGHARGTGRGWVHEHVVIAEAALGHPLPDGAQVHHVDERKDRNVNDNLCILQNQSEHNDLHTRMRVRAAGGNPFTQRLCTTCHQVKDFDQFYRPRGRRFSSQCKPCARSAALARQLLTS